MVDATSSPQVSEGKFRKSFFVTLLSFMMLGMLMLLASGEALKEGPNLFNRELKGGCSNNGKECKIADDCCGDLECDGSCCTFELGAKCKTSPDACGDLLCLDKAVCTPGDYAPCAENADCCGDSMTCEGPVGAQGCCGKVSTSCSEDYESCCGDLDCSDEYDDVTAGATCCVKTAMEGCTANADCCGDSTCTGTTTKTCCLNLGSSCNGDASCCSKGCGNNKCCILRGNTCTMASECCSPTDTCTANGAGTLVCTVASRRLEL